MRHLPQCRTVREHLVRQRRVRHPVVHRRLPRDGQRRDNRLQRVQQRRARHHLGRRHVHRDGMLRRLRSVRLRLRHHLRHLQVRSNTQVQRHTGRGAYLRIAMRSNAAHAAAYGDGVCTISSCTAGYQLTGSGSSTSCDACRHVFRAIWLESCALCTLPCSRSMLRWSAWTDASCILVLPPPSAATAQMPPPGVLVCAPLPRAMLAMSCLVLALARRASPAGA